MTKGIQMNPAANRCLRLLVFLSVGLAMPMQLRAQSAPEAQSPVILTPPAANTPRINGPKIFGVSPGSPFLYSIPATGQRPMKFSADGLPSGLNLDEATGRVTGKLDQPGEHQVVLHAANSLGQAERPFKIVVGDQIGLTPAMGWNNYNLTGAHIDQKTILAQAHAMVDSGLAQHGWAYVNTDDGWQGLRGGGWNAIQADSNDFPDIAAMVREIHDLGLKAGIYSSPWVTTYDRHIGGTSEDPQGKWSPDLAKANDKDHSQQLPFAIGKFHFAMQDAQQFAAWGFDYAILSSVFPTTAPTRF
jgi:alpha-galactosidase